MLTWLADIGERTPASARRGLNHYTVHPPVAVVSMPHTGVPRYWRFSCVGLVLECFRVGAGIRLLDWEGAPTPLVDRATLEGCYPVFALVSVAIAERLGVSGDGPWSIVLPGYVFHALNRPDADIRARPYVPASIAEAAFPQGDA
jgi:hypothetical protein